MNRVLVPLLTSAGLLGGFGAARATGVRAAGGGVLGAVGAAVFVLVLRRSGPLRAAIVVLAYLGAFGGSHPLAKRLGAWPSVFTVAAATAVPAALLAGPRKA
jgi:hypothetical protein